MSTALTITVAPTFTRDYQKASVGLQTLAEGAIKDLLRRAQSDPGGWRRLYDLVAGLTRRVLEIDLAGGPRLLALDDGDLVLWRMGDHDLISKVTKNKPKFPDPSNTEELPRQFHLDERCSLFPPDADEGFIDYATERSAEWIYWLDDQQAEFASFAVHTIEDKFLNGGRLVLGLLGGPGTGKTTILVQVLKQLADLEPDGARLRVSLDAPSAVINQIENSTGWDLEHLRLDLDTIETQQPDLILLDDPRSFGNIDEVMEAAPQASIVFGFDPLQMTESVTDDQITEWSNDTGADLRWLSTCYRQKAVVGRVAKHVVDVIAASSPFLRSDKKDRHTLERAELTRRSNELTFVNPSGVHRTITSPSWDEWDSYWRGLYRLQRQGRLWTHWPPLLVVTDPKADIDDRWLARLDPIPTHRCTTDNLAVVKGLEYQHVVLLLGEALFNSVNGGFEGSGQSAYNRYRLFRIPFSRAKDSLTTFVFDTVDY